MTIAMSTHQGNWRGKDEAAMGAAVQEVVGRAITAGTIGKASPYYGLTLDEYRAMATPPAALTVLKKAAE